MKWWNGSTTTKFNKIFDMMKIKHSFLLKKERLVPFFTVIMRRAPFHCLYFFFTHSFDGKRNRVALAPSLHETKIIKYGKI